MTNKQADVYHMRFFTPVKGSLLDELAVTGLFPEDFQLHRSQRLGRYVPLWDDMQSALTYVKAMDEEDTYVLEIELPYEMNGRLARLGPGLFGVRILPPQYIVDAHEPKGFRTDYLSLKASEQKCPVRCGNCGEIFKSAALIPVSAASRTPTCPKCGAVGIMIPIKEEQDYRAYDMAEEEEKAKKRHKRKKKKRKHSFVGCGSDIQEFALYMGRMPGAAEPIAESMDLLTELSVEPVWDEGMGGYRNKDEIMARILELQDLSDDQEAVENRIDYDAYRIYSGLQKMAYPYLYDLNKGDSFKFINRSDRTVYQVMRIDEDGTIYYKDLTDPKAHKRHSEPENAPQVQIVKEAVCLHCNTVYSVDDIPIDSASRKLTCICGSRVFSSLPMQEAIEPAEETPSEFFVGKKTDKRLRRKNPFRNDDRHTQVKIDERPTQIRNRSRVGDYEERQQFLHEHSWNEPAIIPVEDTPVLWRGPTKREEPHELSEEDIVTRTETDDQLFPEFKKEGPIA